MSGRGRLVIVGVSLSLVVIGCGSDEPAPTTTTTIAEQSTVTLRPATNELVSDLPPVEAGAEMFEMFVPEVRLGDSCEVCHSANGDARGWGPILDGIGELAATRVEGMSAEEYLRESIVDPKAFILGGWEPFMPENYARALSEKQIDDLISFLLTQ